MSSRAAGARKKLTEPKPPKDDKVKDPSNSKPLRGLFSRSKQTDVRKQATSPVPPTPPPKPQQPPPSQPIPPSRSQIDVPQFTGRGIAAPRPEQAYDERRDNHQRPPPAPPSNRSGYSPPSNFVPYPSPQEPSRALSPPVGSLAEFPVPPVHSFLEATYQPPPPPSGSFSRPRPLPVRPDNREKSAYVPSSQSQPSTYSPSVPRSPQPYNAFNSLLLGQSSRGGDSPKPPSYRSTSPEHQLSLQVPTNAPGSLRDHGGHTDYDSAYGGIYPSPPPSDSLRLMREDYSPEQAVAQRGRGYSGYEADRHLAPPTSPYSSADAAQRNASSQSHGAASISSSSSSSSHRSVQLATVSPKSPGFVFPGGRSTARPKEGASLKLKFKKGKDKGKDKVPISPTSPDRRPGVITPSTSGTSSTSSDTPLSSAGGRPRAISSATTDTNTSMVTTNTRSTGSSQSSQDKRPGFVYPGGRSRAQPKSAPLTIPNLKLKGKSSRSSKGSLKSSDGKGKSTFMGIPLRRKASRDEPPGSPLAFTLALSERSSDDYYGEGASEILSTTSNGGPAGPEFEAYRDEQMQPEVRRHERMARIKSRIGSYPLDPYDSVLLDNDRHTGDLLNRLNGTGSPTFFNYGTMPPSTVLDLGCGQGHWVVDAAIAWKGHGTRVTGYDMVDISKVLMPWAVRQGVADNIRFVRGNFLKQRLPFPDNSFDLVRMSSLALAITADAWIFVFQEVYRVLTVGGRLELVDDAIIFPYGKPQSFGPELTSEPAPRLDIHIPSSAFSTFSVYDDSELRNPGLGALRDEDEDDLYELYQVQEEGEDDVDDTATISGQELEQRPRNLRTDFPGTPMPRRRDRSLASAQNRTRCQTWKKHAATCRDLESLFEHMLTHKFGIHMSPEEFVLDLMQEVFGHAREVASMHLSLAPPDVALDDESPRGRGDEAKRSGRYNNFGANFRHIPSPSPARTVRSGGRAVGTPLSRSPGLILSPATFIPMNQQELEIHASKHLRMLLSCKKFLVEHAMEATEDDEIDEDSVLEALWEYEGFLRARFNHPPDCPENDSSPAPSVRESILSMSSDGQDAMWEYQTELRQRFAWPVDDGPGTPTTPRSQITPKVASPALASPEYGEQGRDSPAASIAPPYSRGEMTHVRTFKVYEAIKLDESLLGSSLSAI